MFQSIEYRNSDEQEPFRLRRRRIQPLKLSAKQMASARSCWLCITAQMITSLDRRDVKLLALSPTPSLSQLEGQHSSKKIGNVVPSVCGLAWTYDVYSGYQPLSTYGSATGNTFLY